MSYALVLFFSLLLLLFLLLLLLYQSSHELPPHLYDLFILSYDSFFVPTIYHLYRMRVYVLSAKEYNIFLKFPSIYVRPSLFFLDPSITFSVILCLSLYIYIYVYVCINYSNSLSLSLSLLPLYLSL